MCVVEFSLKDDNKVCIIYFRYLAGIDELVLRRAFKNSICLNTVCM
jgi:hypothetical protein